MTNPFKKRKSPPPKKRKTTPKKRSSARRAPKSVADLLLTEIPNFGPPPPRSASASSVLTAKDLYSAVQAMQKTPSSLPTALSQSSAAAQLQQHHANQAYSQQLQSLNNLLNQKGAGSMANVGYGSLGALQPLGRPMTPQKAMTPPKYLEGYKVTVRSGKTVWVVHHWEERNDSYSGMTRYYYLEDERGRQTRETENDLHIFDEAAILAAKKAAVDFDTVVIEDEKRQQILEALEQISQYELIFEKWGFGETIEKGKGVSMLFYGPPGTGKTLMAQAIANKLEYTLKVISTADIESSAPGEAERNIRKAFKDAKDGKTILLFDECDSLIFSRSATGPILGAQINELLSQIERFDGITLFTTNRLGTLDEAVNRRLALKLEFSMPTLEQRAEIWKRMFPKQAPVGKDVDWSRLAIVEITGGYIKNAVLRAARMAAIEKIPDDKKEIRMKHLVKALKLETESMIEFEDARAEHHGGVGVADVESGAGTIVKRRRDMQRRMGRG